MSTYKKIIISWRLSISKTWN